MEIVAFHDAVFFCDGLLSIVKRMKLKARLEKSLSERELGQVIGAYDIVGDMAIVMVPEELESQEQIIAEAILSSNNKIRVVVKRAGNYRGEFRVIPLQHLAGEDRKETEVKEFGVRLLVNPEIAYYSVRSGNERRRIASLVGPGESVLVLFSGIAPYPLIIAKYSKAQSIIGIEKNPQAHHYGLQNLKRNKKLKNIQLYLGDVREVLPTFGESFDRVIMPLPTRGEIFLPWALRALKSKGFLHFYDMQHPQKTSQSVEKIRFVCGKMNRQLQLSRITKCGHCGPQSYRICIDTKIS